MAGQATSRVDILDRRDVVVRKRSTRRLADDSGVVEDVVSAVQESESESESSTADNLSDYSPAYRPANEIQRVIFKLDDGF